MYCINCGAQLPDHAKFCHNCGFKVENLRPEEGPPSPAVAEAAEQVADIREAVSEAESPADEPVTAVPEAPAEDIKEIGETAAVSGAPSTVSGQAKDVPASADASESAVHAFSTAGAGAAVSTSADAPEAAGAAVSGAEAVAASTAADTVSNAAEEPPAPEQPPAAVSAEAEKQESAPSVPRKETEPAAPAEAAPKRSSGRKFLIIAAVLALIVLAAVILPKLGSGGVKGGLKKAQQLTEAGQYQEALDELYALSEKHPENQEILAAQIAAYDGAMLEAAESQDTDAVIKAAGEELVFLSGARSAGGGEETIESAYGQVLSRYDSATVAAFEDRRPDDALRLLGEKEALFPDYDASKDTTVETIAGMIADEALSLSSAGDYVGALDKLKAANELTPSQWDDVADLIYSEWISEALGEDGNREELDAISMRLISDSEVLSGLEHQQERLERAIKDQEIHDQFETLAAGVLPYLEADDKLNAMRYAGGQLVPDDGALHDLYEYIDDHELEFSVEPLVYANGPKSLGLYMDNGSVYLYYGAYVNGQRSGRAAWLNCGGGLLDLDVYYAVTDWENDLPNGEFESYTISRLDDETTRTVTARGRVVDGFYDGEVSMEYSDLGKVFYPSYTNGIIEIQDTVDPNGNESNVVGYTRDKRAWISADGAFTALLMYGIHGFGR